jgi:uncharacterized protein (DUF983 family)
MNQISCPKCNQSIDSDSELCESCGMQLKEVDEPATPPQGKGAFLYVIFIVVGLGLLVDGHYLMGGFLLAAGILFIIARVRNWLKLGRQIN